MYKQKNGPMMRAGYNKKAVTPFKYENPVDPKTGKPTAVTAVQETVSSPMGNRPRPTTPIGTFESSGRSSGAMVSDLKRGARKIYTAITGNDGASAPSWMQNK